MVSAKFFSGKDKETAKAKDNRADNRNSEKSAPVQSRTFRWDYWVK